MKIIKTQHPKLKDATKHHLGRNSKLYVCVFKKDKNLRSVILPAT